MLLKNLKKKDKFKFNDNIYVVVRRYLSDEKPLISKVDHWFYDEHRFHNPDLEIEKL